LKPIKTILVWVLALQILNMSIYSDAYWSSYENPLMSRYNNQADPTETIVEWIVESKLGQQAAFTYDNNNIDSKNVVKPLILPAVIQSQENLFFIVKKNNNTAFPGFISRLAFRSREVISPPPNTIS
jgi:hypothetical protein